MDIWPALLTFLDDDVLCKHVMKETLNYTTYVIGEIELYAGCLNWSLTNI